MIIVEGPDGSGKSTLVKSLAGDLRLGVAGRVVNAQTQALVDLKEWTETNVQAGFQRRLFDRHRLISDPIYRLCVPGKRQAPELYHTEWLPSMLKRFYAAQPLIIYCLPPQSAVMYNVAHGEDDNSVIAPVADKIYYAYAARYAMDRALYPESTLLHDYQSPAAYLSTATSVRYHLRTRSPQ